MAFAGESGAPTIARALARPHNGFSILRLGLAVAVVVSHGFSIPTGRIADEPLEALTGFTLGSHAVNGFFAVSGFLVTMSLDRRGLLDYLLARTLRILPGLVAATLVVSLLLGPALTRLPLADYLGSPDLWRFVRRTLTTFKSSQSLPGVFGENPSHSALATVWTLKYEVLCYLTVFLAGLLGLIRWRWRWLSAALVAGLSMALVAASMLYPVLPDRIETPLRLFLIFSAGGALYLWRDRVRLTAWPLLGLVLAALLHATPVYRTVLFLAETYAAIWIAFLPALARPALDLPVDLSYGVYLYGWPIQQTLFQLWPQAPTLLLLAGSLIAGCAVAALSWFAVEKPALRLKSRAMGRRTIGTIEPAGP